MNLPENMRLFRFNAGMAWTGEVQGFPNHTIILKNPRPFHGAPNGFPDLAGWTMVEILPEMVGQKIAVFTGVEGKATGTLRSDQKAFKSLVEDSGGRFLILRPGIAGF